MTIVSGAHTLPIIGLQPSALGAIMDAAAEAQAVGPSAEEYHPFREKACNLKN